MITSTFERGRRRIEAGAVRLAMQDTLGRLAACNGAVDVGRTTPLAALAPSPVPASTPGPDPDPAANPVGFLATVGAATLLTSLAGPVMGVTCLSLGMGLRL